MPEDDTSPSLWDESEYSPFPAFAEWAPADFDTGLVDRYEMQLRALRGRVSEADLDRALQVVNRYAAIDTGAIEGLYQVDRGFTKTVATQTAAWESALKLKGEGVARAIDDALGAYDYVLDAVTEAVQITEVWIRELHQIICASQNTFTVHTAVGPQAQALPKGRYKEMPNSPTNASTGRVHAYAPPSQTPAEMARLITELRSPLFRAAHPVVQAAYAHYAYVAIHPFADGNGRVARALASVYLYRSPGVPLVVFADQRDRYLDALEAADGGDSGPFVAFVEARTMDAVSLLEASLNADSWTADSDIADLREIFGDASDNAQILQAIDRFSKSAQTSLSAALSSIGLPDAMTVSVTPGGPVPALPDGWSATGPSGRFFASVRSEVPVSLERYFPFEIVRRSAGTGAEFGIVREDGSIMVEMWMRDVTPTETEAFRLRTELWADRSARWIVHQVTEDARRLR